MDGFGGGGGGGSDVVFESKNEGREIADDFSSRLSSERVQPGVSWGFQLQKRLSRSQQRCEICKAGWLISCHQSQDFLSVPLPFPLAVLLQKLCFSAKNALLHILLPNSECPISLNFWFFSCTFSASRALMCAF